MTNLCEIFGVKEFQPFTLSSKADGMVYRIADNRLQYSYYGSTWADSDFNHYIHSSVTLVDHETEVREEIQRAVDNVIDAIEELQTACPEYEIVIEKEYGIFTRIALKDVQNVYDGGERTIVLSSI